MLLGQPRVFAFALDVERLPLRIQILGPDLNLRALFDLVAHAPARFYRLRELGQALGVERIGAVEEFEAGLVQVNDGYAFEFQAVLREPFARRRPSPPRRSPACRSCRSSSVICAAAVRSAAANRPSNSSRALVGISVRRPSVWAARLTCFAGRTDANEEVGDDIDTHPVLGDQALRLATRHLNPHHIHADRSDFVQDRNDKCAATDDDLLAAESGPDEGGLLGRAPVEPAQQVDSDHDEDRQTISQRITDPTVSAPIAISP